MFVHCANLYLAHQVVGKIKGRFQFATQIPRNLVFCQCERAQQLRRFSSAKKLIDSRPRSSTALRPGRDPGPPVDVSRLPPVPLSMFM